MLTTAALIASAAPTLQSTPPPSAPGNTTPMAIGNNPATQNQLATQQLHDKGHRPEGSDRSRPVATHINELKTAGTETDRT